MLQHRATSALRLVVRCVPFVLEGRTQKPSQSELFFCVQLDPCRRGRLVCAGRTNSLRGGGGQYRNMGGRERLVWILTGLVLLAMEFMV